MSNRINYLFNKNNHLGLIYVVRKNSTLAVDKWLNKRD